MTNETKTKHTPTPWAVKGYKIQDGGWLYDIHSIAFDEPMDARNKIATMTSLQGGENAGFIVRAVNSHEELLRAAKQMFGYLQSLDPGMPFEDWAATQGVEKAIAKAEGK